MSEYSDFIRWQAGCVSRPGFGATAGDTMHCGLQDYNEPYPCPNGLPIDRRPLGECESWRKRIEKTRRDSDEISRYFQNKDRLIEMASRDTQDEVTVFVSQITTERDESEFASDARAFAQRVIEFRLLKETT